MRVLPPAAKRKKGRGGDFFGKKRNRLSAVGISATRKHSEIGRAHV